MNDIKNVNSLEYWDERFHTGDWDSKLGRQQSRYFAQLAVSHLPQWFRHAMRAADLTVCDWGCAEGDGTEVLADLFGSSRVTGVDFSASAIENARKQYPAITFTASNWLADNRPDQTWDVVFSSNTLEHFHDPEKVLLALLSHARKCVVLLVPYREFERHAEHHYTFEASNIALAPSAEYSLAHASVIDSNRINSTFWSGEQILLIYARPTFAADSGVTLSDLSLDDEKMTAFTGEPTHMREANKANAALVADLKCTVVERDATIAEYDAMIAQLSLELSAIKLTRGWKALTLLHHARRTVMPGDSPYLKGARDILHGGAFIFRCARYAKIVDIGHFLYYARRHGMRSAIGRARGRIARVEGFRAMRAPVQPPTHDSHTDRRLDELKACLRDHPYKGVYVMGSCCMGWHEVFKQRPHHIAEYLMAHGYLVVCAMNPIYPDDYTEYLRRESDNLFIVNFDNRTIWSQVVGLLAVESTAPLFYHLVGTEPGTTPADLKRLKAMGFVICYDYIDEISRDINPGLSDMCLERHRALMKDEEVLFIASAGNLYTPVSKLRSRNLLLAPNGVRLEDWVLEDDMPVPQEINHLVNEGKPIVGYYGNLATWMDFDCIKALSLQRPDLNIVMIGHDYDGGKGAFAQSRISELPNVHILPAQKYHRLKFFSRFFDIGIIPFREYELTRSVSPVKMFEYMAQGLPVVATGLQECRNYASCLNADNPDDFVEKVGTALALKTHKAYLGQLRRDAEANTWEMRGEAIEAAMTVMIPRTKDKLLSLVVPAYNMESLLTRCVDSMLAPSQLTRLEIIVVNDGSKDESAKIARRLAARYPGTIRVIDKENGGHGSCINVGIREAKGRYFKIVDADDWLDRYSLTLHMNFLARTDTDMIVTNYLRVFDDDSGELVSYADRLKEHAYAIEDLYSALLTDTSSLSYVHMHAITYRTELLRNIDIQITENSFYVDQEYISFPQPHINNACYQDIALYRYYIGRPGQSVSPEVARKRAPQNLKILKHIIALLESLPAQSASRAYVLNIAFHHTWFYLINSSDESIHHDLLQWWRAQHEGYSRELDQHFHIL